MHQRCVLLVTVHRMIECSALLHHNCHWYLYLYTLPSEFSSNVAMLIKADSILKASLQYLELPGDFLYFCSASLQLLIQTLVFCLKQH